MQRRNFLSGTIATFLGSQMPWTVLNTEPVCSIPDSYPDEILRACNLSSEVLRKFKGYYILDTGQYLASPNITAIDIVKTKYNHISQIVWHYGEVKCFKRFTVEKFALIFEIGNLVSISNITRTTLDPRDTIKLKYKLSLS